MTKELLIRFIERRVSEQEQAHVLSWINQDKRNEEYYISLKNLLVMQGLSGKKASLRELEQIRALTGCRETAQADTEVTAADAARMKRITDKLHLYKWTSIAACVLLVLSVGLNLTKTGGKPADTSRIAVLDSLPADQKNYYYTVKGAKARLELPDGSVVWLNSDSKLTYPCRFEGKTREVQLSGEALFEVVKNREIPMVVNTNRNLKIKVYGTSFNVRSYDNDIKAVTTLYNGEIELITKDSRGKEKITRMLPNQIYEIADTAPEVPVETQIADLTEITNQRAWTEGRLVFDNTPLGEVIKSLERWHGTLFEIQDASILDFTITATFRSESIVQIMEMLEYCALIDYSIDNNKVLLRRRK